MAFICNNQPTKLKVLEQFIINLTRELNTTITPAGSDTQNFRRRRKG